MTRATPTAGGGPRPVFGSTVEARKLSSTAANFASVGPEFSYAVLDETGQGPPGGERRGFARRRTKLRSGKLVENGGQFITECLVHNRSASGCRLRLSAGIALPPRLLFYDDQSERLFQAAVMWQRDRDVGLRLLPCATTGLNRATAERMRRKFYVLRR